MAIAPAKAAVDPRMVRTLCFEDLHVGMRETLMKTVMETDVVGFANISGDENPIHLCDTYAQSTRFGQRIAHGLYTASLISAVLGTRLPGAGAVYRSQTLNFHAPVKIGDVVTVMVEVIELVPEGRRVRLHARRWSTMSWCWMERRSCGAGTAQGVTAWPGRLDLSDPLDLRAR
jgi:3-hydroxybutyryl-CoA dehydratase